MQKVKCCELTERQQPCYQSFILVIFLFLPLMPSSSSSWFDEPVEQSFDADPKDYVRVSYRTAQATLCTHYWDSASQSFQPGSSHRADVVYDKDGNHFKEPVYYERVYAVNKHNGRFASIDAFSEAEWRSMPLLSAPEAAEAGYTFARK